MKIQKLIIKNIGIIEDTTIEFNKPLLLFYGEIRQGKTTILNAVRWPGEFNKTNQ
jgi:DNA repair exonuclease SbcCD ATPase subunit